MPMLDVIRFELARTIHKRSFWVATLAPVVLIFVVYGISYLSDRNAAQSAAQDAQTITEKAKVGILDESGLISSKQLAAIHIAREASRDDGIQAVKSGQLDAFIYYPADVTRAGVSVYAAYKGLSFSQPYDTVASQLLKSSALNAVKTSIRNNQVASILETDPTVTDTTFKNGQATPGLSAIIWPGLIAITFLVLVVLLSYVALSTTTEEKENRAAEILLTTIRARSLILGKILTVLMLGFVQLLAIAGPLLLAYFLFRDHISLLSSLDLGKIPVDVQAIVLGLLFMVGGFALFACVLVGFGCLFPSANEANRFLGVFIIWAFVPIYTLSYIVDSPHALAVKIFEYFPLTAPTTALVKNTVGVMTVGEAIVPLCIIYASAVLAAIFGINAFRYSAMEYGRRVSVQEILGHISGKK